MKRNDVVDYYRNAAPLTLERGDDAGKSIRGRILGLIKHNKRGGPKPQLVLVYFESINKSMRVKQYKLRLVKN